MTSEEYINVVSMMMENQDRYFNWFMGILAIFLVYVGFVQWRFGTKQIEQIKERTKQETITEIEQILGVSSLTELNSDIKKRVEDIERKINMSDATQLYYELIPLQYEENFLWRIPLIIDAYNAYISDNIRNFNSFVSDFSGLITVTQNEGKLKEGIDSPHIDRIINKLTEIEKGFNEKSDRLEDLNKLISFYRTHEK